MHQTKQIHYQIIYPNLQIIDKLFEELKTITIPEYKCNLTQFIKRPESSIFDFKDRLSTNYPDSVLEEAEINIKYEGYIKKTKKDAEKMLKLAQKQIPEDINYDDVPNLASEARQKLKLIRPLTIAQATRISGVNPSDISILLVYLKRFYNEH